MSALHMLSRALGAPGTRVRQVARWHVWSLHEPARTYVMGTPLVALSLIVVSIVSGAPAFHFRPALIFLALIGCGIGATEATRMLKEPQGTIARDLQSVWYLAIAVVLPPVFSFIAPVPLAAHKLWRTRRTVVYRRIFSNSVISLAYGSASFVFHAMPSTIAGASPGTGAHTISWVAAVIAVGLLGVIINATFLVVAIRLSDPTSRMRELVANRESLTSDLLELSLAVSLTLVVAINPFLMALALPSVILCRRYLMQSQLMAQARIDAKTGLLNAGTWQREALAEFYRSLRSGKPLALIMIDVDHFASVNDTVGYPAGDQVLRGIASTLREHLGGFELIGRFKGEEFAVLLPHTGEQEARRIGERIRDHVSGAPIAVEDGNHSGFVFRLTVSIGIAILDHSRRALTELVGAAEAALSEAKGSGRNRICVMDGFRDADAGA